MKKPEEIFPISINKNGQEYLLNSEEEIESHADLLSKEDWTKISRKIDCFSLGFVEKFKEEVNWIFTMACETFSDEFVECFKDKIPWDHLVHWTKYNDETTEFLFRNLRFINLKQLKIKKAVIEDHLATLSDYSIDNKQEVEKYINYQKNLEHLIAAKKEQLKTL